MTAKMFGGFFIPEGFIGIWFSKRRSLSLDKSKFFLKACRNSWTGIGLLNIFFQNRLS